MTVKPAINLANISFVEIKIFRKTLEIKKYPSFIFVT